jgi:hypothetical protein
MLKIWKKLSKHTLFIINIVSKLWIIIIISTAESKWKINK